MTMHRDSNNVPTLPDIVVRGSRIFIDNVLPARPDGQLVTDQDIGEQTHATFQRLQDALRSVGAELEDLVRINTYYVYNGRENEATIYWEKMTAVRLQYFTDPGPVGTAVRVAATARPAALIQLQVEALSPALRESRQRIMPDDSWDWSVPVPLSQGWRQADQIWVGGQVSADRRGRATHLDDLKSQTREVLHYISNVLHDGGANYADLLHLKICYLHDGDHDAAEQRLSEIMSSLRSTYGAALPAITAFGVNLLYEGLLLEIDASAIINSANDRNPSIEIENRNWAAQTQVSARGQRIQISGQSPLTQSNAPLDKHLLSGLEQCMAIAQAKGATAKSMARFSVFVSEDALAQHGTDDLSFVYRTLRSFCGNQPAPAVTVSVVKGLPGRASVQVDGVAILAEDQTAK